MELPARIEGPVPVLRILDVPVQQASMPTAEEAVRRLVESGARATLLYVNAHAVNVSQVNPRYRDVLQGADLVLNDGLGLSIAGWLRSSPFPANLNGSDFTPRVLEILAAHGCSVFFLGARPGVAEGAAQRLQAVIPGLRVAGCHHGYFDEAQSPAVARRIRATGAHALVVAMGIPRQELWLADHLEATGARFGMGVGAFLDFASGHVPRAPLLVRAARAEWLFRLLLEPRRLARRYLYGNPLFLMNVLREQRDMHDDGRVRHA